MLDEFIIMPNHIHGILIFHGSVMNDGPNGDGGDDGSVETQNFASLQQTPQQQPKPSQNKIWQPNKFGPQSKNLDSVIRGFKSGVKSYATTNNIEFTWQPRFHDRIIRNQNEFNRIKNYIRNNPKNWENDEYK